MKCFPSSDGKKRKSSHSNDHDHILFCRSNGDINYDDDDMMPHREMAIDVPSNFVPKPKEKPRLTNSNSLGKEEKIKKYQGEVKNRKEQELK